MASNDSLITYANLIRFASNIAIEKPRNLLTTGAISGTYYYLSWSQGDTVTTNPVKGTIYCGNVGDDLVTFTGSSYNSYWVSIVDVVEGENYMYNGRVYNYDDTTNGQTRHQASIIVTDADNKIVLSDLCITTDTAKSRYRFQIPTGGTKLIVTHYGTSISDSGKQAFSLTRAVPVNGKSETDSHRYANFSVTPGTYYVKNIDPSKSYVVYLDGSYDTFSSYGITSSNMASVNTVNITKNAKIYISGSGSTANNEEFKTGILYNGIDIVSLANRVAALENS